MIDLPATNHAAAMCKQLMAVPEGRSIARHILATLAKQAAFVRTYTLPSLHVLCEQGTNKAK